MTRLFLLILASSMTVCATAADIPPHFIGEWVTFGARFNRREVLTNGTGIYIHTNGAAAVISAPSAPGLPGTHTGLVGTATYDEKTTALVINLRYTDTRKLKVTCTYDAEARTMTADNNPSLKSSDSMRLMRRQKEVPEQVLKGLGMMKGETEK